MRFGHGEDVHPVGCVRPKALPTVPPRGEGSVTLEHQMIDTQLSKEVGQTYARLASTNHGGTKFPHDTPRIFRSFAVNLGSRNTLAERDPRTDTVS